MTLPCSDKQAVIKSLLAVMCLICLMSLFPGTASGDWLQFGGNPQHEGNNREEKVISKENIAHLTQAFQVSLPGIVDGCPAFLSDVSTTQGLKDLLFVTTKQGQIAAIDAITGKSVWLRLHPAVKCRVNKGIIRCYTTASPAIDPHRNFVYTYGLDGYVHKHRVEDGEEITGQGWPVLTTLKPYDEKGSSNLSIATNKKGESYLYVVHSGYLGDKGNYQGHVTSVDLSTGNQTVFNANCSNVAVHLAPPHAKPFCSAVRSGIWGRAGAVYHKELDRIFTATGNGPFEPGRYNWGDTVLALNPDGTGSLGKPLDSYTPANFAELQKRDLDLGSTIPAILPAPAKSRIRHLGLQSGKDSLLRLLNLEDLSGKGGPGHTGGEIGRPIPVPQGGEVLTAPAVWVNPADRSGWVFIANKKGICGLTVIADETGVPSLKVQWVQKQGGTSPVIANNILFSASSGKIQALDPASGRRLWMNKTINSVHWQSPIVANGFLYITDEIGLLTAFTPSPSISIP